nr:FAD-dependent oxidoreductase [Ornithinimicrobium murale]
MTSSDTATYAADVLVIGGGMAGMTAALAATRAGKRVVVVDKASAFGGSAAISGGFVWTVRSVEEFASQCPLGDLELGHVLVEGYPALIARLADTGVELGDEQPVLYGRGRRLDVLGYIRRVCRKVAAHDGILAPITQVCSLVQEGRKVTGAQVRDAGGLTTILAERTVLATGGFQGNRALLHRHLKGSAARLLHRAGPQSTGDGLTLGISAGAGTSRGMDAFYGHLVASGIPEFTERQFVRFAQFCSDQGLLLNTDGRRFTDESLGDHMNAQQVARQTEGRALLVFDHATRRRAAASFVPGLESYDPVVECSTAGARLTSGEDLSAVAAGAAVWGYPAESVAGLPAGADSSAVAKSRLGAPPYYAVEVRPAITFTEGGLRIDPGGRVLDPAGTVIPGLYSAGADAGGLFAGGYAGGLASAGVFGMVAVEDG